ncbi:MAG TPA: WecB/TagA/CpsF family glycosyltransferase, partial [Myxococcaceae bacterium]|nr:WecB/TagA/CpsF family glycosyltransferase [Myxococcaceae bacterium]
MSNGKAPRRLQIGQLWIDALTFAEAIDAIETLVHDRRGGAVFTPNIDHVVNAESDPQFRAAYSRAALSLVDGKPLVWVSPLLGVRLPEKISGADLIAPVMERAAERGWGVYLLGGAPGVAPRAAEVLAARFAVKVVGHAAPAVGPRGECPPAVLDAIRAARPELVL